MADNKVSFSERLAMVKSSLTREAVAESLSAIAPPGVSVEKYVEHLLNVCRTNQRVLNSTPASLYHALVESITLGLPIGGVLGYGYVVPYKTQAQFQIGYQGLMHLAYNDGRVTTIAAQVVRAGDEFDYNLGSNPFVSYRPLMERSADREIIGAFACLNNREGVPFVEVAPIADLDDHAKQYIRKDRDTGELPSDALYRTNPIRWYQKTMLRKVLKYAPLSEAARTVLNREEYIERGLTLEEPALRDGDEQPTDDLRALAGSAPPLEAEGDNGE